MLSAACIATFMVAFFPQLSLTSEIPNLQPGDIAPPFAVQTIRHLLKYGNGNESIKGPIVFLAYNERSGFLERLFTKPGGFLELLCNSPDNVHYVFLFYNNNQVSHCGSRANNWASKLYDTYVRDLMKYRGTGNSGRRHESQSARYRRFPKQEKERDPLPREVEEHWRNRMHFASFPVSSFGNWIPRVLSQWYCSGHGCGFNQIVVENNKSAMLCIIRRLDARYDWLPSPDTLAKYGHIRLVFVGDACSAYMRPVRGQLALVLRNGTTCSYFTKVQNCEKNGALGVLVVNNPSSPLVDMNCIESECDVPLSIPASMIPFEEVYRLMDNTDLFIRFQTTPSDTFVFGIDGEGRVQEAGWFLYPSMLFLAYQAQWFNYKSQLLHNLTSSQAKVIKIFNQTVMQGEKGISTTVNLPSFSDLQRYEHVELDMSLSCPGTRDDTCALWDHVVQLSVCCDSASKLCGMELGRWITPFRRRIGQWLTPIKPLIPLLASAVLNSTSQCNFTMKTVPWAKPWVPSLSIRLVSTVQVLKKYKSWNAMEKSLVPFKLEPLFRGGKFDTSYNKKYKPVTFIPPIETERVKLVATITGHGSDNNNCAEFCVTSHHFVVNNKQNYTRVFKNAGTAMGCAERVQEGVVPNEHGTWLYGRDGWCDGQEVVPWVVDITAAVRMDGTNNTITYYGWFNNTDPNPTRNPGKIIMYSFLAYYKYLTP